jgi:hypothetical protein
MESIAKLKGTHNTSRESTAKPREPTTNQGNPELNA